LAKDKGDRLRWAGLNRWQLYTCADALAVAGTDFGNIDISHSISVHISILKKHQYTSQFVCHQLKTGDSSLTDKAN
jgi:hypothetical protein